MKYRRHSTTLRKKEECNPRWFLLDATGKTLGRLAAEVAQILRGKHKVDFTPHTDTGDGVVVVNAEKLAVTGAKASRKVYRYYTGHIGGLREVPYDIMRARKPAYILEHAVKGMMPRTRLGRKQLKRLRIFKGAEHDLSAQQPIQANI